MSISASQSPENNPFLHGAESEYSYPAHMADLQVMSWNIWKGGSEIDDALQKQVAVINSQPIEILLLQECVGDAAVRLGRELGMGVAQQGFDCAILSPYPMRRLQTSTMPYATAAIIETRCGDILVWSIHLASWDYGPYYPDELAHNPSTILAHRGEQMRAEQAASIVSETERLLSGMTTPIPVVIGGDFNVPSGEDWAGVIRSKVNWPATQQFIDAGYIDAYRTCYPDPAKAPGLSWSHIEPLEKEPRDRIDFIYIKGLEVTAASHLGDSTDPDYAASDAGFVEYGGTAKLIPNQRNNGFPSDHLAVLASLRPHEG